MSNLELTPRISIVVPVFDERDNLGPLVTRVRHVFDTIEWTWELIVVDDGSTDGSGEVLDVLAAEEPRLRVLHFITTCGQSAALCAGFGASRGVLIAVLDGDLQTYPEDLPEMCERLAADDVDAVVGMRVPRSDRWWKRLTSRCANSVRNWLTREDIEDTGCPLKVFRRDAILSIRMFDGAHRFLPTLLRLEGFRVLQVAVRHTRRQHGRSKYGTWDRAFSSLRDALAVRWMQDRRLDWRNR